MKGNKTHLGKKTRGVFEAMVCQSWQIVASLKGGFVWYSKLPMLFIGHFLHWVSKTWISRGIAVTTHSGGNALVVARQ